MQHEYVFFLHSMKFEDRFLLRFLSRKDFILFAKKDGAEQKIHMATCEPSSHLPGAVEFAETDRLPGALGLG